MIERGISVYLSEGVMGC